MEKVIMIAICIIAFFALMGYIFSSKEDDRLENAAVGGIIWYHVYSLHDTNCFIYRIYSYMCKDHVRNMKKSIFIIVPYLFLICNTILGQGLKPKIDGK